MTSNNIFLPLMVHRILILSSLPTSGIHNSPASHWMAWVMIGRAHEVMKSVICWECALWWLIFAFLRSLRSDRESKVTGKEKESKQWIYGSKEINIFETYYQRECFLVLEKRNCRFDFFLALLFVSCKCI